MYSEEESSVTEECGDDRNLPTTSSEETTSVVLPKDLRFGAIPKRHSGLPSHIGNSGRRGSSSSNFFKFILDKYELTK
jgi:hypothetical protein